MTNDNASPRRVAMLRGGLMSLIAVAVACGLWLAGCDDPANSTPSTTNGGRVVPPGSDGRCGSFISNAMDMLQPDRLSISSEPETAVGLLNQWRLSCATSESEGEEANPAGEALLERLLSEDDRQQIAQEQFVVRDALNIRDAILFRKTLDVALPARGSDLDRITELFDYVTRTVQLIPAADSAIPFTPFHVLVFGRGTAQDRAWIFADLLRQMRIDAVILETDSGGDASNGESPWLIGVLLDDEVYLFDAKLGWSVPSAEDDGSTPTVRRPATLREVVEHSDLLRRLDLSDDEPYPITSDQIKTARVRCIGQMGLWSTRMRLLQQELSGDNAVVVSDPLQAGSWGVGMVERIANGSGGLWTKEDVGVWTYPERQLDGYENRSEEQMARIRIIQLPFNAPKDFELDKETQQIKVLGPQRLQLKTRIGQLLGDFKKSIQSYMLIRTRPKVLQPLLTTEEDVYMHVRAAEDALVWSGVCQFEQGDYDLAARTFRDYLRSWPTGVWRDYCRRLLAFCEIEQGNVDNATDVLEATAEDGPQRHGDELLIRRWRKVAANKE